MNAHMIIFYITLLIWAVPEFIRLRTKRNNDAIKHDRGSMYVLVISWVLGLYLAGLLMHFQAFAFKWYGSLWFYIGIIIMLAGVIFRAYAIKVLGRYFTTVVAISSNQEVIQTGPYRYIRHPAYTGTLLVLLGSGIAMTNWLSLIVVVVFGLVGHLIRVRVEEKLLCKSIGQPYVEYMRRTKRFIPFIL